MPYLTEHLWQRIGRRLERPLGGTPLGDITSISQASYLEPQHLHAHHDPEVSGAEQECESVQVVAFVQVVVLAGGGTDGCVDAIGPRRARSNCRA